MIEVIRDGRLLRITLNRPEKRNALSLDLCRQLVTAFEAADSDTSVGAILLNGNGKCFCAGMDLSEMAVVDSQALSDLHEKLFTLGARITKPIVAAVHGAALGGGTGLAANAHILVAAPDASFGLTEIRIGLWPFLIFRSVALAVGERRATELALTGRTFQGAEACQLGLVHHVAEDPQKSALHVAEIVANSSATAIADGLEFVREMRGKSWDEGGQIARRTRATALNSDDFAEGVDAFLNKRTPIWPSLLL